MIVIYWIWKHGRRRKTYKFVGHAAMIGFGISQGF